MNRYTRKPIMKQPKPLVEILRDTIVDMVR